MGTEEQRIRTKTKIHTIMTFLCRFGESPGMAGGSHSDNPSLWGPHGTKKVQPGARKGPRLSAAPVGVLAGPLKGPGRILQEVISLPPTRAFPTCHLQPVY